MSEHHEPTEPKKHEDDEVETGEGFIEPVAADVEPGAPDEPPPHP